MTRADLSVLIPLMPLLDVHITVLGYALVSPEFLLHLSYCLILHLNLALLYRIIMFFDKLKERFTALFNGLRLFLIHLFYYEVHIYPLMFYNLDLIRLMLLQYHFCLSEA